MAGRLNPLTPLSPRLGGGAHVRHKGEIDKLEHSELISVAKKKFDFALQEGANRRPAPLDTLHGCEFVFDNMLYLMEIRRARHSRNVMKRVENSLMPSRIFSYLCGGSAEMGPYAPQEGTLAWSQHVVHISWT
jgi:hypothetical protein